MRLECSKCIVRDWLRSDKSALVKFANNRKIWRNLTHIFPHPYTEKDAEDWFALLDKMKTPTHWAIELDGLSIGGIGITLREGILAKSAEIGYWLGEPYWGRGITSEALAAVVDYAMLQFGLIRLEAPVFEWNPASMRVLEKCGFVREAILRSGAIKDGKVTDLYLYALVKDKN